jgi:hypothetical protein
MNFTYFFFLSLDIQISVIYLALFFSSFLSLLCSDAKLDTYVCLRWIQ